MFRVCLTDYRVEQHFPYLVVSNWEVEAGREVVTRSQDVENVFFLGVAISAVVIKCVVVGMFSFLLQISCAYFCVCVGVYVFLCESVCWSEGRDLLIMAWCYHELVK